MFVPAIFWGGHDQENCPGAVQYQRTGNVGNQSNLLLEHTSARADLDNK